MNACTLPHGTISLRSSRSRDFPKRSIPLRPSPLPLPPSSLYPSSPLVPSPSLLLSLFFFLLPPEIQERGHRRRPSPLPSLYPPPSSRPCPLDRPDPSISSARAPSPPLLHLHASPETEVYIGVIEAITQRDHLTVSAIHLITHQNRQNG